MGGSDAGKWLEKALIRLCNQVDNEFSLEDHVIQGVVSYCELASPEDAREYLNNIVGQEIVQPLLEEYMQKRGCVNSSTETGHILKPNLQTYIKPPADEGLTIGVRKQTRKPKDEVNISKQEGISDPKPTGAQSIQRTATNVSKKKKSGKLVSLADAAKGSIVFQQGKPCSCQARRHKLVSNCLSCGKIVCEQEGEGPCSFCGALVLRDGSTYAGLDQTAVPLSEAEAAAEAFRKRLVDYDRNSALRTTVIDDQSDYYEVEGSKWLSAETLADPYSLFK
ncbi:Activating signal cointegrator 1 [Nymphaea thermarum]|nr:Activating signal cointegrator 1 [Nymphaea thermarum]